MRNPLIDIAGKKFGRLTAIKHISTNKHHKRIWQFKCDCGAITNKLWSSVKNGDTISCGCYLKEMITRRNTKHSNSIRKKSTAEYCIWLNMKNRCLNPNNNHFDRYGGRGIKICDRWINNFNNFLDDMGKRPSKEYSIDRINNDGNYEPSNCRWLLSKKQRHNVSVNVYHEYNGLRMIQRDWCIKWGISDSLLIGQLNRGKSFEDIYLYYEGGNKKKHIYFKYKGELRTRGGWAAYIGIDRSTFNKEFNKTNNISKTIRFFNKLKFNTIKGHI